MTDNKLTDNEIIKALECCSNDCDGSGCGNCPLGDVYPDCELDGQIIDLINRQKAEIERLNKANTSVVEHLKKARRQIKAAKAEAIKEFAERLKDKASDFEFGKAVWVVYIDNLVKEMVGDGDG